MVGRRQPGTDLFLVEVRSCPPRADDAVQMQRALSRAVSRLGGSGSSIRWCAAWLLPDEGRCLCLVRATGSADVTRAVDLAALTTASVSAARVLTPSPPSTGSES